MDVNKIRIQIESISDTTDIYLIEALSDVAGFFSSDGKLLYLAKDIYGYSNEGIETDYLKLQTHIRITSVKNSQTFKDDYYNIIIYKGELDDLNILSFIQLCSVYSTNLEELSFRDFFYSLISLFQFPTEQTFRNAMGLYGELKFMQFAKERRGIDISDSWHRNGSYSHYDFSNKESSLEIKTTMSDSLEVTIKHDQIFGEHPCTLVVINCDQYENGETIEEVIHTMYSEPNAFNGMNFCINLAKELKRISKSDIKEVRFSVKKILFFSAIDINPFSVVPDSVSDLSYKLDVSELTNLSETEENAIIEHFLL